MCTEMSANTQLWLHQISHHPKTVRVEQIRASGTDEGFCIQAKLCVCVAAVKRFKTLIYMVASSTFSKLSC